MLFICNSSTQNTSSASRLQYTGFAFPPMYPIYSPEKRAPFAPRTSMFASIDITSLISRKVLLMPAQFQYTEDHALVIYCVLFLISQIGATGGGVS